MTNEQANCAEIRKLKQYLRAKHIEFSCPDSTNEPYSMARVHFEICDCSYSCIHGWGSYGGENIFHKDMGLLELWHIDARDPVGLLSADDVIEIIECGGIEMYEKKKGEKIR